MYSKDLTFDPKDLRKHTEKEIRFNKNILIF